MELKYINCKMPSVSQQQTENEELGMDLDNPDVVFQAEQTLVSGRIIKDVEDVLTAAKLDKVDIQLNTQVSWKFENCQGIYDKD